MASTTDQRHIVIVGMIGLPLPQPIADYDTDIGFP